MADVKLTMRDGTWANLEGIDNGAQIGWLVSGMVNGRNDEVNVSGENGGATRRIRLRDIDRIEVTRVPAGPQTGEKDHA